MDWITEFKKITATDFFNFFWVFMAVIPPGIIGIFLFDPELFYKLDAFKLVLLSMSLVLPVFSINFFFGWLIFMSVEDNAEKMGLVMGTLGTIMVIYFALLRAYSMDITLNRFIIDVFVGCGIYFLALLLVVHVIIPADKKEQKKNKKKNVRKRPQSTGK